MEQIKEISINDLKKRAGDIFGKWQQEGMEIDLPRGDVGNYIGIVCYILGVIHYGWENAQAVYAKFRERWSKQAIKKEVEKVNPDKSIIEGAKINENDCRNDIKEVAEALLTAAGKTPDHTKVSLIFIFEKRFDKKELIGYTVTVELERPRVLS